MSLKNIIIKQFDNILDILTEAEKELSNITNPEITSIKTDINIAKNRVIKFQKAKRL